MPKSVMMKPLSTKTVAFDKVAVVAISRAPSRRCVGAPSDCHRHNMTLTWRQWCVGFGHWVASSPTRASLPELRARAAAAGDDGENHLHPGLEVSHLCFCNAQDGSLDMSTARPTRATLLGNG